MSTADLIRFLQHPMPVVTIVGPSGAGKTATAQAILTDLIRRGAAVAPDPYRFHFASAFRFFQSIRRAAVGDADFNSDCLAELAGFLALDDIHLLDRRDEVAFMACVSSRTDKGLVTILTAASLTDIPRFGPGIERRVREGRVVYLGA
ncbi:MAG: hypothetical protein ACREQ5_04435 [Candidatus Dormibacteria bacterium]